MGHPGAGGSGVLNEHATQAGRVDESDPGEIAHRRREDVDGSDLTVVLWITGFRYEIGKLGCVDFFGSIV